MRTLEEKNANKGDNIRGYVSYNELISIWDAYCIAMGQNFDEEGEPK